MLEGPIGIIGEVRPSHSPPRCSRTYAAGRSTGLKHCSIKPIADIKVGDLVLAEDPETGEKGPREVTALWVHQDELVDLVVGGANLTTTEDHPFWNATDRDWQDAAAIDPGEMLITADGTLVPAHGLRPGSTYTGTAYNLTVGGLHTYYVTASGKGGAAGPTTGPAVLVHNCPPADDIPTPVDDVHNILNKAGRGVDDEHVWANGSLYTQVRGEETRLVKVLPRGKWPERRRHQRAGRVDRDLDGCLRRKLGRSDRGRTVAMTVRATLTTEVVVFLMEEVLSGRLSREAGCTLVRPWVEGDLPSTPLAESGAQLIHGFDIVSCDGLQHHSSMVASDADYLFPEEVVTQKCRSWLRAARPG